MTHSLKYLDKKNEINHFLHKSLKIILTADNQRIRRAIYIGDIL